MSKYDPLAQYLRRLTTSSVTLTFREVDAIVGGLPASARTDRTWWGNTTNRTRTQAHAWMGAGWLVDTVNFTANQVTFRKKA